MFAVYIHIIINIINNKNILFIIINCCYGGSSLPGETIANAILIPNVPTTGTYTATGSTSSYQHNYPIINKCDIERTTPINAPDVVYKLNIVSAPSGNPTFNINTFGSSFDTILVILDGSENILYCNDDISLNYDSQLVETLGVGIYYIVVTGYDNSGNYVGEGKDRGNYVLNVGYNPRSPTNVVYGDPHIRNELGKGKDGKKRTTHTLTPFFGQNGIYNFFSDCAFQINARIDSPHGEGKNPQYVTGIYMDLFNEIKIAYTTDMTAKNISKENYFYEMNGSKTKENNHVLTTSNNDTIRIAFRPLSLEMELEFNRVNVTIKQQGSSKYRYMMLVFRPHADWQSRTIHGIVGFPDRYDYENIKQSHWIYGIPGNIDDYRIRDNKENLYFGTKFVFNQYKENKNCLHHKKRSINNKVDKRPKEVNENYGFYITNIKNNEYF